MFMKCEFYLHFVTSVLLGTPALSPILAADAPTVVIQAKVPCQATHSSTCRPAGSSTLLPPLFTSDGTVLPSATP